MIMEDCCPQSSSEGLNSNVSSAVKSENSDNNSGRHSLDRELGLATCRVCQCAEPDSRGDAALEFLGIKSPSQKSSESNEEVRVSSIDKVMKDNLVSETNSIAKIGENESRFVEFISPDGEIFTCSADIGMGSYHHHNTLINLGCACKGDLALAHYACALKWFVNHGSTICEICGFVAKNVRTSDIKKIFLSLRDYEALRDRTACGEPNPEQVQTDLGINPDAIAAIRRQRLIGIGVSLWFGAPSSNHSVLSNDPSTVLQVVSQQPLNTVIRNDVAAVNPATKWAVEGTGILLATGLLTVTLVYLIAPRVGKKTARNGLHILLGGVCALALVVFFRFVVLTRIRYGPARYWALVFVFWFLVFGIWASRTHRAHST